MGPVARPNGERAVCLGGNDMINHFGPSRRVVTAARKSRRLHSIHIRSSKILPKYDLSRIHMKSQHGSSGSSEW